MHTAYTLAWALAVVCVGIRIVGALDFRSVGDMSESATSLDFREMLRKERQLARKKGREQKDGQGRNSLRAQENCLAKRKSRLELRRDYHVEVPVQGIYYVPDFVTREEGSRLQEAVRRGAEGAGESGWRDLYKRRLQIHGGTPHPSGMVEEELPPFLQEVCSALVDAGIFPESSPPNHVLLNEYSEGQGIGPHKDGPLYEGRVAILSLGRTARLDFWGSLEDAEADWAAAATLPIGGSSIRLQAGEESPAAAEAERGEKALATRALASVTCESCSLLVFEGQAYHDVWHGIVSAGRGHDVPTTSAAGGLAGNQTPPENPEMKHPWMTDDPRRGRGADRRRPLDERIDATGDRLLLHDMEGRCNDKRLSFTIRRVVRVVPRESQVIEHPEAQAERERRRRVFERSVTEVGVRPR